MFPGSIPHAGCCRGTTTMARDARRPTASAAPPAAEMCPSPRVVYCVYQTEGCMEKPDCPALLTSPGDEREATNSFAELLRYLISSNCSWEDRGKERASAVDGGKGKRMVEMGRKKGIRGTDGNPWDRMRARIKKEREREGQRMNDGGKQRKKKEKNRQTKNWSQKQRDGRRDKEGCTLPGPTEQLGQEGWWGREQVTARPHPGPAELGCTGWEMQPPHHGMALPIWRLQSH